ncbi:RNA exonuclease 1-like protein [Oopsacas minuta]|uniref:RNA exonuclease 1-like protein n=1 Tax=Oopsacas minuta TaxID=111878 RepID=A0AAV7K5Y7_9METZ|nr:RNA exonuclease 1-like protein [Oopsacas minuta]KAI6655830.1 RNA exonuclease 1-like protein [Oopsacas minuta]
MFPSSGYFRALPCPYFPQEECYRPHCQFKHSKPKIPIRTGTFPRENLTKKLPHFLQRNTTEPKHSPTSSSTEILPDIFNHTEPTQSVCAPDFTSVVNPVSSSSSPPAPRYSPLPESPPNSDPTSTLLTQDDNTSPEIGEACEETFIFTSAPTSTDDSKSNESESTIESNIETDLLGSASNPSDSEISNATCSVYANDTTPDEGTSLFLQPDIIAKLQAPLAPLKRRAESSTSETSQSDTSPIIKRKRMMLTAEKRPNVLVMSKTIPKLSTNSILIDRDSIYMPKSSRLGSNVISKVTTSTKPSLPMTMDSKVPVKMRQKFLDKVFSEYVKVLPENDAHSKAKGDEKKIYDRTTNKQTYTGICLNTLKKIRIRVNRALGNNKPNKLDDSKSVSKNDTTNLDVEATTPDSTTAVICNSNIIKSKDSLTSLGAVSTDNTPTTPFGDNSVLLKSFDSLAERLNIPDNCNKSQNNEFYILLEKYLLTEEQLIENAYPMKTSIQGVAEIKVTPSSTEPHDINPKAKRHCCARCGKNFIIMNNGSYMRAEECWYHHGKAYNQKVGGEWIAVFSCCQSSSFNGCQVADKHVTSGEKPAKRTGYTLLQKPTEGKEKRIFALDCEMVYTSIGLELARVSIIDYNHNTVYDSYVKPYNQVIDYNTRFSGITVPKLTGILPNLKQVQRDLKQIMFNDSILIGHSLESDLKALKIIHNRVVDTAIVFPHRKGGLFKRALSTLTREYLEKIIQDDEGGHDSVEDAIACIELMELQISQDREKLQKQKKF